MARTCSPGGAKSPSLPPPSLLATPRRLRAWKSNPTSQASGGESGKGRKPPEERQRGDASSTESLAFKGCPKNAFFLLHLGESLKKKSLLSPHSPASCTSQHCQAPPNPTKTTRPLAKPAGERLSGHGLKPRAHRARTSHTSPHSGLANGCRDLRELFHL